MAGNLCRLTLQPLPLDAMTDTSDLSYAFGERRGHLSAATDLKLARRICHRTAHQVANLRASEVTQATEFLAGVEIRIFNREWPLPGFARETKQTFTASRQNIETIWH